MSRFRSDTIKTAAAVLAVAGVSAMPALAAGGGELAAGAGVKRVGTWAREVEDGQRREARRGPVVPVVGKPDYGTAENAFGAARSGHAHEGQDIFAPAGTPLVAVADGVVAEVGTDGGQGNYVYLYDPRARSTYVYMHMISPSPLRAGERVQAGERLGGVGCTGSCWGDHLHFEVRTGRGIAGAARDPLPLLRRWSALERPR